MVTVKLYIVCPFTKAGLGATLADPPVCQQQSPECSSPPGEDQTSGMNASVFLTRPKALLLPCQYHTELTVFLVFWVRTLPRTTLAQESCFIVRKVCVQRPCHGVH